MSFLSTNQKSLHCHQLKAPDEFPLRMRSGTSGNEQNKTCGPCVTAKRAARNEKSNKENKSVTKLSAKSTLPLVMLTSFLELLKTQKNTLEIEARVDVASLKDVGEDVYDHCKCADVLVEEISKCMKYCFT
jgi:hypothetical protein